LLSSDKQWGFRTLRWQKWAFSIHRNLFNNSAAENKSLFERNDRVDREPRWLKNEGLCFFGKKSFRFHKNLLFERRSVLLSGELYRLFLDIRGTVLVLFSGWSRKSRTHFYFCSNSHDCLGEP